MISLPLLEPECLNPEDAQGFPLKHLGRAGFWEFLLGEDLDVALLREIEHLTVGS